MIPSFVPNIGTDGLATDVPIISYTEKILEEKELKLKQYIQDNYSKIRNVEKELANLALEVKLTAGPKKLALEHLRKKIEISTEKIKSAKLREEQARKVWILAEKTVKAEEANKQALCDDLNRLVQESAAAQYSRLEDLSQRLEALNPDLKGTTAQIFAVSNDNFNSTQLLGDGNMVERAAASQPSQLSKSTDDNLILETSPVDLGSEIQEKHPVAQGRGGDQGRGRGRGRGLGGGRGRGRISGSRAWGALVLQGPKYNAGGGWNGAGFDVDDETS